MTAFLARYDTMVRAIAEAHAVDEVIAIRDKAVMLETYARLSCDTDNERKAYEIRVRAERKYGELRTPPPMGRPIKSAPGGELLPHGVSPKQDKTWRNLSAVPEEIFEHELTNGASTKGIIKAAKPPEVHKDATIPASQIPQQQPAHGNSDIAQTSDIFRLI